MAEAIDIPPNVQSLLLQHAANGAQRQADGAGHYSENLRYDYLEGKHMVSLTEAAGARHLEESGAGRARQTTDTPPPNR